MISRVEHSPAIGIAVLGSQRPAPGVGRFFGSNWGCPRSRPCVPRLIRYPPGCAHHSGVGIRVIRALRPLSPDGCAHAVARGFVHLSAMPFATIPLARNVGGVSYPRLPLFHHWRASRCQDDPVLLIGLVSLLPFRVSVSALWRADPWGIRDAPGCPGVWL